MISSPPAFSRSPLSKLLLVLFVLAIATFITFPNYFTGHWAWRKVAQLENVAGLKAIQTNGVALPGWHTLEQGKLEIGGHKWSAQAIVPASEAKTATLQDATLLMLRPQTWQRDMPQVDWVDINGAQQWTADSIQSLRFTVPSTIPSADQPIEIETRFLRGWHGKKTYAVLQWYAWKTGGSSAPSSWFWTDQFSQLRDRRRTAWVAVSILMPIQPLGDINTHKSQAETLGKLVQSTLTSAL
ncbi:MAG: cyanoexosortase B system-associated protein [Timaviella obliquedivisa GSE-PSE-MK23-08B]|jgi:cyanoexosortase B-associated protein|nr:cyanoexosortase B system-associated protein [Timaviella obliquedivisa GSE-PSE-MK23-08B]